MELKKINHVCSLGNDCKPSFFLKAQELKIKSYPFDWCHSNGESIQHCIEDNFRDLLNQNFYKQDPKNHRRFVHQKIHIVFPHHNPIKDISYHERCVDRFNKMLYSGDPVLFITSISKQMGGGLLEALLKSINTNIHFFYLPKKYKQKKLRIEQLEELHLTDKNYDLKSKYKIELK
tara:strand:- start:38 stop:565 length:528 start_codon:yes stop_codon:yes gene_type:complete